MAMKINGITNRMGLVTRRLLLLGFAGILLSGCSPTPGSAPASLQSSNNPLKVMSFNIRYGTANDGPNHWNNRKDLVVKTIRQFDPDLLGLQEALDFQIDYIQQLIPGYVLIGVGRDDGKRKGEHSCILYRSDRLDSTESGTFWFSDTPEVPGSKSWGNSITRICTWTRLVDRSTGKGFYYFNLHLDHISQPSRQRSAILLAERMANRSHRDEPCILSGDFNVGESNPVIAYLTGQSGLDNSPVTPYPLADSFRKVHPDEKQVGSFNEFKGVPDGDKIDYIFISPEWDALAAEIVRTSVDGRYPSDHFPVTAVLSFKSADHK
ncbi:MAG: endonuclease/exonuclease/phosphatase family protein [Phycisphaerae bacterium]|nr:endonuclease/exonuclease/phosphatase family protein [Phycisphaerae bacterium]